MGLVVADTCPYLTQRPHFSFQPSSTEPNLSSSHHRELRLRCRVACLLEFAFCLLRSAHCALPCAAWYAEQLLEAQAATKSVDLVRVTEEKDAVERFQDFMMAAEPLNACDSRVVLRCFRDLCALLWTCQARDKLSHALRVRALAGGSAVGGARGQVQTEAWLKASTECLSWAQLLLPCSTLLEDGDHSGSLRHCLLSLVAEFPPDKDVADLLIDCGLWPDADGLPADLQNRLTVLQRDWLQIAVSDENSKYLKRRRRSTRHKGESLSSYYQARCIEEPEPWRTRRHLFEDFEPSIVLEGSEALAVGGRAFETEPAFLDWLDVFLSVTLARSLEQLGREEHAVPLLFTLRNKVAEKELAVRFHFSFTVVQLSFPCCFSLG